MSDNNNLETSENFSPFEQRITINVDGNIDTNFNIDNNAIITLPLRDMVIFPMCPQGIPIGRESSLRAIEEAKRKHQAILLICQTDPSVEKPSKLSDLHTTGVIAHPVKVVSTPEGKTLLSMPMAPVKLEKIISSEPYITAKVKEIPSWSKVNKKDQERVELLETLIHDSYLEIINFVEPTKAEELRFDLEQQPNNEAKIRYIINNSPLVSEERQHLLDEYSVLSRYESLITMLSIYSQQFQLRQEIAEKSKAELTQRQKIDFLQNQIRMMQEEISGVSEDDEIEQLRKRAEVKKWPDSASEQFKKELAKLRRFNPNSPDYSVQYSYLDTFLSLPWEDYTEDHINLRKIEQTLNKDHYGLKEVKERILEQMAVIKLRGDMKAPILCLYGPPGVGKTSLGRSIADAIGREYVRVSLGGLHDEAEIRGHRRTYIGSMPGRIIKAIEKCGKSNPVFVLDEIDKIGNDYKGDPSTALLEVLDPEQNNKFHDNYLDCDYDLSKVMFIATANNLSTLSAPLLDRMEIININGYSTEEKIEIARRHLIQKAMKDNGLEDELLSFNKNAIEYIVEHYTRESGVRQLEKKINKVLRKIAVIKASGGIVPVKINKDSITRYLGKEEVMKDVYENNNFPGVVTGLAWTSAGGDILFIESSLSEGKEQKLTLTGNLGNVMKESATIALQYVKANAERLGIDKELIENRNVHIHVPEGAIPKDGPSAGITMVTSLVSSFTGVKVREKTAMTGEMTLRGKVLPVGGIKEKMLAAKRAGITDVVLSKANRKDIEEIPTEYLKGMSFHFVDTIDEVIEFSLHH